MSKMQRVMPWSQRSKELESTEGPYADYAGWREWMDSQRGGFKTHYLGECDKVILYGTFCKAIESTGDPLFIRDVVRQWMIGEMSEISEETSCASWEIGLEFRLWRAVEALPTPHEYLGTTIEPERIERLRDVAEWLGEWVIWQDPDGVTPVPLDVWKSELSVCQTIPPTAPARGVDIAQDDSPQEASGALAEALKDVKWPESQVIDGLELRLTCPSHPEQYDVYDGETQVAYFRLRHGEFRVDVPDCGGETIYYAEPMGDGMFEEDERQEYLTAAVRAVRGLSS